jgi:dihydroorotase
MTAWLLKGVAPYGEEPVDLLIRDGVVATGSARGARVLDAAGLVALPGLVDLHTHLREPGREDAETVETGSRAAALGGYTAVHAMANTEPVADTAGVVEQVWRLGREAGLVDVRPVGAVTVGLAGERLAELGAMADSAARVRVFSDDGKPVHDPQLMRRALEYVKAFDGVVAQHAEEPRLTAGAQMNEGVVAARLGLAGWPAAAEEAMIARDVLLTAHVGSRLHVCHVSTAGSVEILRWAKSKGTALRAALADGTIDAVATDHAPHALEDKETEWAAARPGMLGLETALSVAVLAMRETGLLDWRGLAERMSAAPARIGALTPPALEEGAPASLTLVDPAARWTPDPAASASRSRNTPYAGRELPARVVATFLRGEPTVLDGKAVR